MNHSRWLGMTALSCLWLTMSAAAAAASGASAASAASAVPAHLKYSNRSALAEPALHSSAALVVDTTHDAVLYSRHSDVAMPIASITKLMTALVVMDAGQPLDEALVVSDDDRSLGKGSASRLAPGTHLTRGDLMHLALMASENRAAHALGRNYPGGVAACVIAMNAKARELGMTSAHFVEPTGLSDANVASPEDLSKLVMAAAKVPAIREYSTDSDYVVQVGRRMVQFHNTDSLVNKADWNIVVQKTGYISQAGRCLVMNSFGKRTRVADARRIRKWMEATLVAQAGPLPAST
jgi:D-alanyl-D-alanine endopeptidase (penicillin-binding protein 7)